jgi:hypothetical protein
MAFATNLMEAVHRLGGSDEDIHRLADPERSRSTWDQIAAVVMSNPITLTYKVLVDYAKTLSEMIEAGSYDWVNDDITQDHFPVQGEGSQEVEAVLFHFNK